MPATAFYKSEISRHGKTVGLVKAWRLLPEDFGGNEMLQYLRLSDQWETHLTFVSLPQPNLNNTSSLGRHFRITSYGEFSMPRIPKMRYWKAFGFSSCTSIFRFVESIAALHITLMS